jgi:hypothetical protein
MGLRPADCDGNEAKRVPHKPADATFSPGFDGAKPVLSETPKAVMPCGGLRSFVAFLGQIGFGARAQQLDFLQFGEQRRHRFQRRRFKAWTLPGAFGFDALRHQGSRAGAARDRGGDRLAAFRTLFGDVQESVRGGFTELS